MSTSGDIMSKSGDVQYIREIPWVHWWISWVHRGMFSTLGGGDMWGSKVTKAFQFLLKSWCTEHLSMYSWYRPHASWYPPMYWTSPYVLMTSPNVLNTHRCTHDIPRCIHGIPKWIMISPDVLNILQCTYDIPRCTHGIPLIYLTSPDVLMISPRVLMISSDELMVSPDVLNTLDVLNISLCTEHTLYRVIIATGNSLYSNFSMKIPYFKICRFQIILNFHYFLFYVLFNIKFYHMELFEIMEFCNKWWNYCCCEEEQPLLCHKTWGCPFSTVALPFELVSWRSYVKMGNGLLAFSLL